MYEKNSSSTPSYGRLYYGCTETINLSLQQQHCFARFAKVWCRNMCNCKWCSIVIYFCFAVNIMECVCLFTIAASSRTIDWTHSERDIVFALFGIGIGTAVVDRFEVLVLDLRASPHVTFLTQCTRCIRIQQSSYWAHNYVTSFVETRIIPWPQLIPCFSGSYQRIIASAYLFEYYVFFFFDSSQQYCAEPGGVLSWEVLRMILRSILTQRYYFFIRRTTKVCIWSRMLFYVFVSDATISIGLFVSTVQNRGVHCVWFSTVALTCVACDVWFSTAVW